MEDCVFCKIVRGEIPARKVYEDKEWLGFLDVRPLNPGHTLVIPKIHVRWVDDLENFGEYFEAAKKVGLAIKKALNSVTVCYITVGYGVPHAHIHVIPRFENDEHGEIPTSEHIKNIAAAEMDKITEKIRKVVDTKKE